MKTEKKLTAAEMEELLDRHMQCELDANFSGLLATLARDVVWGREDDPYKLVGRPTIEMHYSALLAPGRNRAQRIRGWYDEERQDSSTEYMVTTFTPDGQEFSFPVLALVDFQDGLMRTENLYFYDGRTPSQVLPKEELERQGAIYSEAMLLNLR